MEVKLNDKWFERIDKAYEDGAQEMAEAILNELEKQYPKTNNRSIQAGFMKLRGIMIDKIKNGKIKPE